LLFLFTLVLALMLVLMFDIGVGVDVVALYLLLGIWLFGVLVFDVLCLRWYFVFGVRCSVFGVLYFSIVSCVGVFVGVVAV